jgi:hypothetical protein
VKDWRLVEGGLHQHFKKQRVEDVAGTRELFAIPTHAACKQLRTTSADLRVGNDKTKRIFANHALSLFLFRIFQMSGLFGSLDLQGAWTLNVLPKTVGGRSFTLNIGSHKVAFSAMRDAKGEIVHGLVLDRLILDYPETVLWLGKHDGDVVEDAYRSGRERAVLITFCSDFANAEKVLSLAGVRRAISAYWSEGLADLRQRNAKSAYARHHSYDAVSELIEYKRSTENIFGS